MTSLPVVHTFHGAAPFTYSTHIAAYPLVGIAGIAIGEVFADPPGEEVAVTTIDGYLYVFGVSFVGMPGSASFSLSLLCSVASIGALGAQNAIHAGDYAMNGTLTAGQDGKPEIYVAGSMGLRRFDVEEAP